jgi:Tfp pilus assembly PilM family ATPase
MTEGTLPATANMPFSLRKNSNDASVGLDIDGRYLAAAQVKDGRLVRAISAELPEGVVRDGEVADSERLVEALKDFVSAADLPKGVHLGVANQQIVVRVVELPRIEGDAEREAAVRFQAAEAIAMPLDDTVLDYQVAGYAEAPDGTPRMQVVLVAARRKMIEQLTAAVKEAGLKAEGIDLDAFALVRALVPPTEDGAAEDSSRVYVHLGGITNLAVAVGNVCFFARPLSAVWSDPDASSLLADEIRLSIDYYMAQPRAKSVGQVVLSGPGSSDEELTRQLGIELGLPVEVAGPLGSLDASALAPEDDPRRYTVAAGLSLGAAA